jgi:hypothetical protein
VRRARRPASATAHPLASSNPNRLPVPFSRAVISEKEIAVGANRPSRSATGRGHVVEGLQRGIHRLLADLENLADTGANRKRSLVS